MRLETRQSLIMTKSVICYRSNCPKLRPQPPLLSTHCRDVRQRTAPDGSVTQFEYGLSNFALAVTDAVGDTITYDRDIFGEIWSETGPNGTRLMTRDAAGNMISQTDRNGRVTNRTFTTRDQVATETWLDVDGSEVRELVFGFTVDGQLASTTDGDNSIVRDYSRNNLRNLVSETNDHAGLPVPVTLDWDFDAIGRVETSAAATGETSLFANTYEYIDPLGRLSRIGQSGPGLATLNVGYEYATGLDSAAQITRSSNATGSQNVVSTYSYDDRGLVDTLTHSGATTINQYDFDFDAAGRLEKSVDRYDTAFFEYDDAGQLRSASHSADTLSGELYEYGPDGRRTFQAGQPSPYQYEAGHRLVSDGVRSFAYDDEGNVIETVIIASNVRTTFEYDHRNRLTKVTQRSGEGDVVQVTTMTYDPLDRRIGLRVDRSFVDEEVTEQSFVYDGADVVLEFLGDGQVAPTLDAVNLFGPGTDEILAVQRGGEVLWALPDHLGTIRDVASADGTLANHVTVDSFGNVVTQTNADASIRYVLAGREFDVATGLYYLRARYLDPATGRFISEDPLGPIDGDIHSFRYAFQRPNLPK